MRYSVGVRCKAYDEDIDKSYKCVANATIGKCTPTYSSSSAGHQWYDKLWDAIAQLVCDTIQYSNRTYNTTFLNNVRVEDGYSDNTNVSLNFNVRCTVTWKKLYETSDNSYCAKYYTYTFETDTSENLFSIALTEFVRQTIIHDIENWGIISANIEFLDAIPASEQT